MNLFSKRKVILYLAGIFLAGIITGGFLTFKLGKYLMPNQERIAARWCGELQKKLDLTSEQVESIKPIIGETINEFRTSLLNEALSSLSNCNARIEVELTPEQKARFATLVKEQENFIRNKCAVGTERPPENQQQ